MPLKRTGLKLDFSLLNLPEKDDKKTHLPTDDYLKQHIDALLIQMKQMPVSFIKEAENAPDYPMLQQCGYSSRYNGFHLSNDCGDVFIRARREKPHCAGGFEGDKFHLSVHESQIAQAATMQCCKQTVLSSLTTTITPGPTLAILTFSYLKASSLVKG